MKAAHYQFKVGRIACTVLLDGVSILGAEGIVRRFPDGTETAYRRAFTAMGMSLDDAASSMNILLAKLDTEMTLVDAGQGGKPNGGMLTASLSEAGITPESITSIIITHAHIDHVMGLLDDNGAAVFPNARYIISKPEWAYWQQQLHSTAADQQPVAAMMQEKGLRFINMDEQIMSGLSAIPIPGHTPGQIGLLFESEGEQLLHLADLLHSPMQFAQPEWSAKFDVDTSVSIPTRQATLGHAADVGFLTLFYHLAFPGLGHVKRAGTNFIWNAVTTNS